MRAGRFRLLVAADRADHPDTEMLQPLTGDEPNPAGSCMKQHRVTGLGAGNLAHEKLRGHALEHHRGALPVAQAVGKLDQNRRWNDARLLVRAGTATCTGDPVPAAPTANPSTSLLDDPAPSPAPPPPPSHNTPHTPP